MYRACCALYARWDEEREYAKDLVPCPALRFVLIEYSKQVLHTAFSICEV